MNINLNGRSSRVENIFQDILLYLILDNQLKTRLNSYLIKTANNKIQNGLRSLRPFFFAQLIEANPLDFNSLILL